ncbi:MAG: hypothetical protein ACREVX_14635 [Clostridium sp.]
MAMMGVVSSVYFIFILGVVGISVYTMILFIKALQIYIKKNS